MRSPVGVLQTAVLLVIGAGSLTANVVVDWNAIAAQNMAVGNTLSHTREFAILHVAIYDAVVSIVPAYRPYGFAVRGPKHASTEAAALTAAHDVLVAFHPDKAGSLDVRYASDLDKIQDGWARSEGIQIGRQVAARVL